MAKPREFTIKESASEIKSLRKQQSSFKFEKRLIWLESILSNRFKTRKPLCDYLGISPKSSERWTLKYINDGVKGLNSPEMLEINGGGKKPRRIFGEY